MKLTGFIAIVLLSMWPTGALPDTADVAELQRQVKQLQADLNALKESLKVSSGATQSGNAVGGGDGKPDTICPDGTYAVGVKWWGAPPPTRYCIGCLSGMQVICRPLTLPK